MPFKYDPFGHGIIDDLSESEPSSDGKADKEWAKDWAVRLLDSDAPIRQEIFKELLNGGHQQSDIDLIESYLSNLDAD
jgi:hypothetical protein